MLSGLLDSLRGGQPVRVRLDGTVQCFEEGDDLRDLFRREIQRFQ